MHKNNNGFFEKLNISSDETTDTDLHDLPFCCHKSPWLSSSLVLLQARRMQKILRFRSKTCQWKGRCPEKLSPCSDVYDLRGSCASQFMPPYYIWGPPSWTFENSSNTLHYNLPIGDGCHLITLCNVWFSHSLFQVPGDHPDLVA